MKKSIKTTAFISFTIIYYIITNNVFAQSNETIKSPIDYVSTLVGTLSSFELSNGNTYPVISMPWGMNSWTPQTGKMGDGWQYTYTALKIRGFKQTHQPSPWINDYGEFALMPQISETPKVNEDARASYFSHKAEIARPYLYSVYLADYDTKVTIAPTDRAAILNIQYPKYSSNSNRWLIIDAFDQNSEIKQLNSNTIVGISRKNSGGVPKNFANYFVIKFTSPISKYIQTDTTTDKGREARVAVNISNNSSNQNVYIASSFISVKQAITNLKEVYGKSLNEIEENGRKRWNDVLSRIYVDDDRENLKKIFYSNLYRCLLFPRNFSEITSEGKRVHYSPFSGKVLPGYMYTDTGFWDTFRALMPLVNLIYPDEAIKMQEGFYNTYIESGFFPEWSSPGHRNCMVGNNSASVVTDGLLKGLTNKIPTSKIIEGLLNGANNNHPKIKSTGRLGYKYYNKLGYIPYDVGINENVARTLEYAYDDWCIYRALEKANAPQNLKDIYKKRALNYKNVYDSSVEWMRGRNINGSFQKPFNPYKWGDAFTEGNAIHYTWSVFHDIKGLINLMGGEKKFISKLDTVFSMPPIFDDSYYGFPIHEIREMQIMNMGNYAHGNQPIQHMTYLYDYAGAPYKTQRHVRDVMKKLYTSNVDGYCGDEDNGQTSAWYVFSAMGFYPVTPASNQYAIGVPMFKKITISIPTRKKTIIETNNTKDTYIQSVSINDKQYNKVYLTYDGIISGEKIIFNLGERASNWGSSSISRPYSFSDELKK